MVALGGGGEKIGKKLKFIVGLMYEKEVRLGDKFCLKKKKKVGLERWLSG